MKKIFTLLVCFLAGFTVQAQSDFPLQFVDKDGQIIPDGTVLEITEYEEDELFGDILMPTYVWVKNVSDEMVYGGGSFTIQTIDNGSFQTCFPSSCMNLSSEGTYTSGKDAIMPSQVRDMQTEWLPDPDGKGTCLVAYQLQTFRKLGNNYMPDDDGPTIYLHYFYGVEPTGISQAKAGKTVSSITWYDLFGRQTSDPRRGAFLKRTTYTDGSSIVQKKIIH